MAGKPRTTHSRKFTDSIVDSIVSLWSSTARSVETRVKSSRKIADQALVWPLPLVSLARDKLARVPQMARRILVVDCNTQSSAETEQMLTAAGYRSATVTSFEAATQSLSSDTPDLLLTAVRLGKFNGLHLVLRCRTKHPDLPILVVGDDGDAALAAEATRFGAHFVSRRMDAGELLALIAQLLQ